MTSGRQRTAGGPAGGTRHAERILRRRRPRHKLRQPTIKTTPGAARLAQALQTGAKAVTLVTASRRTETLETISTPAITTAPKRRTRQLLSALKLALKPASSPAIVDKAPRGDRPHPTPRVGLKTITPSQKAQEVPVPTGRPTSLQPRQPATGGLGAQETTCRRKRLRLLRRRVHTRARLTRPPRRQRP